MKKYNNNSGFSLVEISVVLGIIGLVLGGVMAGRHVIASSELNSIVKEAEYYAAAQSLFREKYAAWPGDLHDATRYFGRLSTVTGGDIVTCNNGAADNPSTTSSGTCNGDGNGFPGTGGDGSDDDLNYLELFSWPQHLALGGFIEGTYDGYRYQLTSGASGGLPFPKSRRTGGEWKVVNTSPSARTEYGFNNQQAARIGVALTETSSTVWPLTPEEAWSLDTKMDDGSPTTGNVTTSNGSSANPYPNATLCTLTAGGATGTAATDITATYNMNLPSRACNLLFYQ